MEVDKSFNYSNFYVSFLDTEKVYSELEKFFMGAQSTQKLLLNNHLGICFSICIKPAKVNECLPCTSLYLSISHSIDHFILETESRCSVRLKVISPCMYSQ